MGEMKLWRTAAAEPEGAIPTRRSAALVLAGTAGAMAVWLALGPSEDSTATQPPQPPQVSEDPESTVLQAEAAVEDAAAAQRTAAEAEALLALEAERAAREDPAAQQRERERQRGVVRDLGWPAEVGTAYGGVPPHHLAQGAQLPPPDFAAEAEFRAEQRRALQASLRSPPVAQSLRGTLASAAEDPEAQSAPLPATPAGAGETAPAAPQPPPPAQPPAQPALPPRPPAPTTGRTWR